MTSNALATGRRTYLHESAALDFAIRACEALGLVFWALAPGSDIWATDYSQNTFRVHVGKAANGTRVVTGGGRRAYVAVGERRTVAQADQWSLFSIEEQASDVADTADVAIETVAPVVDTIESLDAELIATTDKGAREAILARRQMALAQAATVADTADTVPATPVAVDGWSKDETGDDVFTTGRYSATVVRTVGGTFSVMLCENGAVVSVGGKLFASHTDENNARYAASQMVGEFVRQDQLRTFVADTVTDGRKPAQAATGATVADTADTAPVDHTVSVEKVRMSSGPGWRAVCTCGHASVAYFAEHAAQSMADAHAKETAPNARTAIEATATAQGWTIEASIVGDRQSTLTRLGVSIELEYNVGGNVKRASVYGQAFGSFGYSDRIAEVTPRDTDKRATVLAWLAAPVGATRAESRDLMRDHVIGAPVEETPVAAFVAGDPVTVRGEGTDGADAHGTVTAYDGNVSVSLEDGSSVYVAPSDVSPRVSDVAAAELAAHRASNDTAPRVMGITGTGVAIRDRESGKEYGFHAACWASFSDAVGPTARLIEVGPLFGDDWTCTQCLDAPSNRWSTDGSRAYATMVGDFGHALATLTPYRDRYELAIEYAATGNRDVFPVHAGDVHAAITEAERRVLREAVAASSNVVSPVAMAHSEPSMGALDSLIEHLDAPSNDVCDECGAADAGLVSADHGASCSLHADNVVPAETEFAARVRTAQAPKVPGIHVARCYRCGERACETLRLPVSSLTNVCSEHADEARAVALRWDAASRYMHEEAPHIASSGRLAVRFTREATNRLDVPLAVIAETLIGADNTFGDIDTTLAQRLDAFTAARGTAPSNPVVGE